MPASSFSHWHKSSHSPNNNNCVQVGEAPGLRGVRDTKLGDASPVLMFPATAFATFLQAVRDDRFTR